MLFIICPVFRIRKGPQKIDFRIRIRIADPNPGSLFFIQFYVFYRIFFYNITAISLPMYQKKGGNCRNIVFKNPKLGYR